MTGVSQPCTGQEDRVVLDYSLYEGPARTVVVDPTKKIATGLKPTLEAAVKEVQTLASTKFTTERLCCSSTAWKLCDRVYRSGDRDERNPGRHPECLGSLAVTDPKLSRWPTGGNTWTIQFEREADHPLLSILSGDLETNIGTAATLPADPVTTTAGRRPSRAWRSSTGSTR